MQITWTVGEAEAVTLGDAGGGYPFEVEDWGGASLVQRDDLFAGANPSLISRDNVSGNFVFVSGKDYGTAAAAVAAVATEYGRLGETGDLRVIEGATTILMAGAILNSVRRTEWTGRRLGVRYTFTITTLVTEEEP